MRERVAQLSRDHREQVLSQYRARHGSVVEGQRSARTLAGLTAAHSRTLAALRAGAPVLASAELFDGRCYGQAQILVTEPDQDSYTVVGATIAHRARPSALLQGAAYADQLQQVGVAVAPTLRLHLGTGRASSHELEPVLSLVRQQRERVEQLLQEHLSAAEPIAWNHAEVNACGRCPACRLAMTQARDVGLVWGLRRNHRAALRQAGITTLDGLAASTAEVPGLHPVRLDRLRTQAQLQREQELAEEAGVSNPVTAKVHTVAALDRIPAPDAGDIFFDFEGDPLWVDSDRSQQGLEYLFGWREAPTAANPDGQYRTIWAHERAQEKQALIDFLAYLYQRRITHPRMHVYHYAFYEPATLRRLAARHRVGEQQVADLLDAGVFVDLYDIVKHGVHVSQQSFSIKMLEPLYMGNQLRDDDGVTSGSDSVVAYARACQQRAAGDDPAWQAHLADLGQYNAYDCLSTLRLRDWLLHQRDLSHEAQLELAVSDATAALGGKSVALAAQAAAPFSSTPSIPSTPPQASTPVRINPGADTSPGSERAALGQQLAAHLREDAWAHDSAAAVVAAALTYHEAEDAPFWQAHHHRLQQLNTLDSDARDVLAVHQASAQPWEPGSGPMRRRLRIEGRFGAGSTVAPGSELFCVYDPPLPFGMSARLGARRATCYATVLGRGLTPAGLDWVEVRERLPAGVTTHDHRPVLLTPGPPPSTAPLSAAIAEVAQGLIGHGPSVAGPALQIARRTPARQIDNASLPELDEDDPAATVRDAVLASAHSYVAVQGPPGTGKTDLTAAVIADLVLTYGWKVGVVAQSHAVVENLLTRAIAATVPPEQVGKRRNGSSAGGQGLRNETSNPPWRVLSNGTVATFLDAPGHPGHTRGRLLGGTAWDFCNPSRVARGQLDLLIVEEAGQFSLANTLAVAVSATRLLLVGDPQQLPQVSQGSHPHPVDRSALAWLAADAAVLPPTHGYFLQRSWRLHPALCRAVSAHSYGDHLSSAPAASQRNLTGIAPGVHVVDVAHDGNSVRSAEESAEVVAQVGHLLGSEWNDGHTSRPLQPADIMVVAAYNGQVHQLRADLDQAGLQAVPVGTVDKFQGQASVVVLLSLAASSADDIPRGARFLLSRNRINVAISRAQWAAIIVRCPALTRHLPSDVAALADLGGFIQLSREAHSRPRRQAAAG
ncbi:MAG: TM0106 family RecB-like putative nuclease [Beutenbergiaceae bacterium]